ncbi:inactive leucine-rich repeat receptor-like protein kinase [Pyrus ussuriensis x Pyrus communis]|uniref:Inactive leucine-rich repeat receptor-like protein kinase n=1 Tax=Pyrus ussuriensis x Pyrus communis TaxID=2448454 RepID=A0A5N5I565_9ROSA|nr:inactive leucine-rich repeat receptor-like protein kinase [Pyrus ussuriensis x Pyrus communis]
MEVWTVAVQSVPHLRFQVPFGRRSGAKQDRELQRKLGFCVSFGFESDISCLKSIKASLEDPSGYLSSWDFSNHTEGFICKFLGIERWHANESEVLNIKLSDLGLKGHFPRGLANCSYLTGLDLSGNKLSGPLPEDFGRILAFITTLDLSSNSFSGKIPRSLPNFSYLNVLKLENNEFSGEIPAQLGQLKRLKTFSVANNLLSGQVPNFGSHTAITAESYANNAGLCGKPLKRCQSTLVKALESNSVVIAAAAGFGIAFPFSVCFFLPRAPSVDRLRVFYRGFKLW